MALPLTTDEEARYTNIIDGILATVDLETVTRKKVRQGLEAATKKDLSSQKEAIKHLIEARFDAISAKAKGIPTPPLVAAPGVPKANGHHPHSPDADGDDDEAVKDEETEEEGGEEINVAPPPSKKQKLKRESSTEDADAKLAAELQAQENRLARSRTTRGGGSNKVVKKKKVAKPAGKKKSEKRARDSDAESGSEGTKEKKKAGGGFSKPFVLSEPLAALCGETQMSRPQVVKKLWEYIKANNLQDPSDKRTIRCDEMMQAIFRTQKVGMFAMNKVLGDHLLPVEEA